MPTIQFVLRDGAIQDLDAEPGMSVMEIAINAGLRGIVADCGGECQCATCHVYLDEPYRAAFPPPGEVEQEMLEGVAAPLNPGSRLSCQLIISQQNDGMIVRIPPTQ